MKTPKIIVFSKRNDPVVLLGQMVEFFYEIQSVLFTIDLKKIPGFKDVVACIIIKPHNHSLEVQKLKQIRSNFPKLPVFIIADSPSKEEIIDAFRVGVSDYLITPVETRELISCLNRHTWIRRNNLNINESPAQRNWNLLKHGFYNLKRKFRLTTPIKFSPKQVQTSLNSTLFPLPIVTGDLPVKKGLFIEMLGEFKIMLNGKKEIIIKGHNAKSLLTYLFCYRKKSIHREKLMSMFWPNSTPNSARNCLNVTIHKIRKIFQDNTFEKNFIIYKDECYSIHPNLCFESDVERFNYYWENGLALENAKKYEKSIHFYYEAIALYKGDFMEDLLYEEWCESERENLKERYLIILDRLSLHSFRQCNYKSTVHLCNIMLGKDNCLEEIHRRLIASYRALGWRDKAIKQFKKCSQSLQKELGIEPSSTTRELYEKISK